MYALRCLNAFYHFQNQKLKTRRPRNNGFPHSLLPPLHFFSLSFLNPPSPLPYSLPSTISHLPSPSSIPPFLILSSPRFRLRYCTVDDCYYLHWDNAVCPPLARIEGFMNGVHSASGVRRHLDEAEGKVGCVCGMCVRACGRAQNSVNTCSNL